MEAVRTFGRCRIRPVKILALSLCLAMACAVSARAKGAYAAGPTNDQLIEAPTAYTLMHGGYQFLMRMYESGGVFVRGDIGFHKLLEVGFSANASNVIGHGDIDVQEPRVALKVKFISQSSRFPLAMAIGWDDRGYGDTVDRRFYPGTQKGLYLVASHEIAKLRGLQLHGGANVVRFGDDYDSENDLAAFAGTCFGISDSFYLTAELDKLMTDQWQFNAGFMVGNGAPIRVGLDLRDINRDELFSRMLRIQYMGFF